MEEKKDYRISFFKPTTEFSRINRNIVIVLILIWGISVFGFQILLRIMEKPTPEKALVNFERVWENVKSGNASTDEKIVFADCILAVLGKSSLAAKPENRTVLNNALSWSVYDLMSGDSLRSDFIAEISTFEKKRTELADLRDPLYVNAKASIIAKTAPLLGLEEHSLKAKLLPLEIKSSGMENFLPENKAKLHGVMSLYLTHNQSVLTDTVFLGFPFHYFYSAVYLLCLFIALCWVYSFIIDRVHTKMGNFDKTKAVNN
jgi:putative solute:sodium symporter small subunit